MDRWLYVGVYVVGLCVVVGGDDEWCGCVGVGWCVVVGCGLD